MQRKKTLGIVVNKNIDLYTVINHAEMEVSLTNYGEIITSVRVSMKNGDLQEVVLGFDKVV